MHISGLFLQGPHFPIPLECPHDLYIMDCFIAHHATPNQIQTLNEVRLFKHIMCLSDVVTDDGISLDPGFFTTIIPNYSLWMATRHSPNHCSHGLMETIYSVVLSLTHTPLLNNCGNPWDHGFIAFHTPRNGGFPHPLITCTVAQPSLIDMDLPPLSISTSPFPITPQSHWYFALWCPLSYHPPCSSSPTRCHYPL